MAEAPSCVKCGGAHWRFVPCGDAEERAAKEKANAEQRARNVVYPEWRSGRDREIKLGRGKDPVKVYPEWLPKTSDGPKAA